MRLIRIATHDIIFAFAWIDVHVTDVLLRAELAESGGAWCGDMIGVHICICPNNSKNSAMHIILSFLFIFYVHGIKYIHDAIPVVVLIKQIC